MTERDAPLEDAVPPGRGRRDASQPRDQPLDALPGSPADLPEASDEIIYQAEVVPRPPVAGPQAKPWPPPPRVRTRRPRRKKLPVILFALTCVSTFWVGATQWMPLGVLWAELQLQFSRQPMSIIQLMPLRQTLVRHWDDGLIYMFCVLAILLTHEMGHFVATLYHRIRASLPYFLPFPINPIGTFGAVITMDALNADRRQMFDIGIAGPLAGLIVALPIMWYGVVKLDLTGPEGGAIALDNPLAVDLLLDHYRPQGYQPGDKVWLSQLNPFFMAGWVGLLVTGLNMLPVSQLDGGHITYTLFGKGAHWIARAFVVLAIAFLIYTNNQTMVLMVILVLLIGVDHPPTRNDRVPLGWFRTALGFASLSIPILCFPPQVFFLANP